MNPRAIIRITAQGKDTLHINYGRRMYAIIRRYTQEVVEGEKNECFGELTGLRTFFKMTYQEIADKIIEDLYMEIGIRFRVRIAKVGDFEIARAVSKKHKNISTYKEINKLFVGKSFIDPSKRRHSRHVRQTKRVRFTVPFLGKVA